VKIFSPTSFVVAPRRLSLYPFPARHSLQLLHLRYTHRIPSHPDMAMSRMAITSLVDNAPPPPLSVLSLLNPMPPSLAPSTPNTPININNIDIFLSRKRPFHALHPLHSLHSHHSPPLYAHRKRPKSPSVPVSISPSPPLSPTASDSTSSSTASSTHSSTTYIHTSKSKSEAERFAASRIIGQKHRDKEANTVDNLRAQVDTLLTKNLALRSSTAKYYSSYSSAEAAMYQYSYPYSYQLSPRSSKVLGSAIGYYWTGAACLILLELIAIRRNLVTFARDASKRRRKNVLECPPDPAIYDRMLRNYYYHYSRMPWDAVLAAHEKLAKFEADRWGCIVTSSSSAISKTANQQVGESKRCSRCRKDKTAGSGHPRSHCDDGLEVCSEIPYEGPNKCLAVSSRASH